MGETRKMNTTLLDVDVEEMAHRIRSEQYEFEKFRMLVGEMFWALVALDWDQFTSIGDFMERFYSLEEMRRFSGRLFDLTRLS